MITAVIAYAAWHYRVEKIEGWTVRIEDQAVAEVTTWASARKVLVRQLQAIERVMPDAPLAKLQEVSIYVNLHTDTTCMAYHPAADWLSEHHMDPAMATNMEIGSIKNFVSWTYEQPWMVLHELAHAYHFRYLEKGELNDTVLDAFRAAMRSKRYDSVLHWNGKMVKHYATTNQMEYFAESTEAYFGTNDFYPFVRSELMTYDQETFALMEKIWGKPVKRL